MVAKRMNVLEASGYRYLQPLKAVDTQGVLAKTPPYTFDKIFDKPQPPRVQSTQILTSMITASRSGTGFIRGFTGEYAIARGACRRFAA
jgi:hypothetical protein